MPRGRANFKGCANAARWDILILIKFNFAQTKTVKIHRTLDNQRCVTAWVGQDGANFIIRNYQGTYFKPSVCVSFTWEIRIPWLLRQC